MKKLFVFAFLGAFVISAALTSCGSNELKNVRGVVKGLHVQGDTLTGLVLAVGEDGDTLLFNVDDANFQRGMTFPGDSAIVDYIEGRGGVLRAFVITMLPKAQPAAPLHTDTLITTPMKEDSIVKKLEAEKERLNIK